MEMSMSSSYAALYITYGLGSILPHSVSGLRRGSIPKELLKEVLFLTLIRDATYIVLNRDNIGPVLGQRRNRF